MTRNQQDIGYPETTRATSWPNIGDNPPQLTKNTAGVEHTNEEKEIFLRAKDVRTRYGGVSDMWLYRKLADERSGFPKPVFFGRFRYWRLSELIAWERQCASSPPPNVQFCKKAAPSNSS